MTEACVSVSCMDVPRFIQASRQASFSGWSVVDSAAVDALAQSRVDAGLVSLGWAPRSGLLGRAAVYISFFKKMLNSFPKQLRRRASPPAVCEAAGSPHPPTARRCLSCYHSYLYGSVRCHNRVPQVVGGALNRDLFLTVLEAGRLGSRCGQGWLLMRPLPVA